jgi:hypothetical protein
MACGSEMVWGRMGLDYNSFCIATDRAGGGELTGISFVLCRKFVILLLGNDW